MTTIGRTVFLVAALILVVGLFAQVFVAGLGVFDGPRNFLTHRDMGYMLSMLPIVLIISGLVGRVGRRLVILAVVVEVLFILQSVFVAMRADNPEIAALHPVNGFVILLLTLVIARDAWALRRTATSGAQVSPDSRVAAATPPP